MIERNFAHTEEKHSKGKQNDLIKMISQPGATRALLKMSIMSTVEWFQKQDAQWIERYACLKERS